MARVCAKAGRAIRRDRKARRDCAKGQTRARHEDSPKSGELGACWGVRTRATMGMKMGGNASGFREGANSSQARRFAKRRRISSLLGCPLAGNDGNENGGNASGFREGANSSQARRFAKRRRISSQARFAADTRFGIFEGGTDLQRTHGSGFSRVARICGGHTARDFRGWHGFAADTRLGIFEGGTDLQRTLG